MKTILYVLVGLLLTGCATSAGLRDGSSQQTAVIISAKNWSEGMLAEDQWLKTHITDAAFTKPAEGVEPRIVSFMQTEYDDQHLFHAYHVHLKDGGKRVIYFDATAFDGDFLKDLLSKKEPNQRLERNAGAASSSISTPSSGMAHP